MKHGTPGSSSLLALLIAACSGQQQASGDVTSAKPSTSIDPSTLPDAAECQATGLVAVSLTTDDGLTLEADFHPAGQVGGPAVMLLHMIPPGNDKSNYPPSFIDALHAAGYSVLNVNRRGAGNSEGEPVDAYESPNGRLDAVAAHHFLTRSGCQAPAGGVAIVGASNGTTTSLDFTVQAAAGDRPPALVWLSPGNYTENQNAVADRVGTLAPIPLFLGYPDSEAEWPEGIRALDTGAWEFHEYEGGQHGSRLFQTDPQIVGEIVTFLDDHRAG